MRLSSSTTDGYGITTQLRKTQHNSWLQTVRGNTARTKIRNLDPVSGEHLKFRYFRSLPRSVDTSIERTAEILVNSRAITNDESGFYLQMTAREKGFNILQKRINRCFKDLTIYSIGRVNLAS